MLWNIQTELWNGNDMLKATGKKNKSLMWDWLRRWQGSGILLSFGLIYFQPGRINRGMGKVCTHAGVDSYLCEVNECKGKGFGRFLCSLVYKRKVWKFLICTNLVLIWWCICKVIAIWPWQFAWPYQVSEIVLYWSLTIIWLQLEATGIF